MSLRIIAGAFRGRRLLAPPGLATRPFPDRIKQAFFDWLGPLDDLVVADICAGSGTVACEALSRGAAQVHAVESAPAAVHVLQANARALGNPPALVLHPRPFQVVLPQLRGIDRCIADPPFPWFTEEPALITTLLELGQRALAPGGRLYLRGERGAEPQALPRGLKQEERRFYGRSWIARYSALASPPPPPSVAPPP